MKEFKGTPGPWKIMSGNIGDDGSEIEAENSPFWAFVSFDTPEAERIPNANLIATAPELLEALQRMLELNCPLIGDPSRAELIEHWEYEHSQGNGAAEDNLFALAVIAKALGEPK